MRKTISIPLIGKKIITPKFRRFVLALQLVLAVVLVFAAISIVLGLLPYGLTLFHK